jgi:hypothetical protein
MSLRRACLEILACILAGLILGSLLMAFLRSSEAAGNWIGELVYLIRHGI